MENSFCRYLSCSPTTKELTEHVDVSTNWYIVGTMFDLDQKRLRSIEGQTGHTDTHKMIEMFNLWLNTTPTASRRQVLDVLRKRVVGENKVADQYEKYLKELHNTNYTPPSTEAVSILQRNIQSLNEALVSPVQVSQLLYCKRCISEATLDEMERIDQKRSLDDKKTTLLTAMQETVSSDYRKLKDIATVLSDVEQTRDIANEIMTKYEETIPQEDDSTVVQPQEAVGGNEGHASDILRNNYSALSQSITEPVRMARLLHEEVISDEALSCVMSTRGSVSDSRAVLLKAVRDTVHSNYKHLELFVTALRKVSETAHIGDTIFEEYIQYFCDEDNNTIEEMETYLAERRSLSDSTSTESGSTCESSEEVKEILGRHKILFPHSMEKKFQELRIKFGSTFFQVRHNFAKDQNLSIDKMKLLVIDCFPDLSSQVLNKKTINGVLEVVKTKCNIINMCPLEVLTVQFNIKEAEKVIKIYKEYAKDFCESTSIQLCLDKELQAVPTPSRLKKETVTFGLKWDPDKYTLQDINDVLKTLEPLENYFIQIKKIDPGSVVVTCYCPTEYTTLLIMAVLGKIEILQEKGLKEFKVGNCTIWNNTAHEVLSAMTTKEIEQPTKKRVNNYEDMERDLLSMKQQLAEKEKQVQELMKEKDQPDEIEIEFDIMHEKLSSLLDSLPVLKKKHKEDREESRRKIEKLEHLVAEKDKKLEQLSQSVAELQMQRKMNKALILENERFKSNIKEKEDRIADLEHCLQDLQQIKHEITQIGSVPEQIKTNIEVQRITESSSKQYVEGKDEICLKGLTFDALESLIPLLFKTKAVNCLNIHSSPFKEPFTHHFSVLIANNLTLKCLLLTHDTINDEGVKSLAHSLKTNMTLTFLSFDFNSKVTSESCRSLADLLHANQTLLVLSLSHTNIDVDGAHLLVKSLESNDPPKLDDRLQSNDPPEPNDPFKLYDPPKPDYPPKPNVTLEWLVLDERLKESFPGISRLKF